jgi:hypothetical protein
MRRKYCWLLADPRTALMGYRRFSFLTAASNAAPTVGLGKAVLHDPIPSAEAFAALTLFKSAEEISRGCQCPRRRGLGLAAPLTPYLADFR